MEMVDSIIYLNALDGEILIAIFYTQGIYRWIECGCMELAPVRLIEMVCEASWRLRR
jgi:hypothetical protein